MFYRVSFSLLILLVVVIKTYGQCLDNLLINGNLNGEVGIATTADGWLSVGDPEIHNHLQAVQVFNHRWVYPIVPSSDSSTWQDLIGFERIFQSIQLEKGSTYRISFEYASHVIIEDEPDAIFQTPLELMPQVWINNIPYHQSPITLVANQWYNDCFLFVAETAQTEVKFGHEEGGYIGFDNICLEQVSSGLDLTDASMCIGEDLVFRADVSENLNVLWSTNQNSNEIIISEPGEYWVDISDECGAFREQFEVTVEDCGCKLYLPDAFSPQTSGVDGSFTLGTNCGLRSYELLIFDRWGSPVYESFDIAESWDGRIDNSDASSGVYFYKVTYDFLDNERIEFGSINLVR